MYAIIQVHLDEVVDSCNCHCHPFAACTVDVTVCFSRQTVSRASHAILHSRHPVDCLLPNRPVGPILSRIRAVGILPATAIPKRLLCFHGICLSLKYFLSINLPASCLSMKSSTHVP